MKAMLVLLMLAVGSLAAGPALAQPAPAQTENIDMLKGAGQACAFGGAVLGVSSLLVLYPALAAGGAGSLPIVNIVVGNTLFGCGIAAVGALAATGFTMFYDSFFGSSEPAATGTTS